MNSGNIARLQGLMADEGLDWLVLSGFDSTCFATGHVSGIETGPSPFSGGPVLALVGRDGSCGLVAPNIDGQQVQAEYESYPGFANAVTDQVGNYLVAARALMRRLGVSGRIGVEPSLPAIVADLLPGDRAGIAEPLKRLRAVKTPAEIDFLRFCGQVAAAGQMTARAVSRPGQTELGALNAIRATMEVMAGERCALAGEYIATANRTAELGLPVSAATMQDGDPVLCDLAPRVAGYWGDSCGSFVIGGTASEAYVALWTAAREALALAEAELRPGLKVGDFDAMLRASMQKRGYGYPHHSGHGVGTSVHEWPRLVPDEDALIEQDMVLMVEPGAYVAGIGGARCEFMFRVTATGCENLTDFVQDWRLK